MQAAQNLCCRAGVGWRFIGCAARAQCSQRLDHLLNQPRMPRSIEEPAKQPIHTRHAGLQASRHLIGKGQQHGAKQLQGLKRHFRRVRRLQHSWQGIQGRRGLLHEQPGLFCQPAPTCRQTRKRRFGWLRKPAFHLLFDSSNGQPFGGHCICWNQAVRPERWLCGWFNLMLGHTCFLCKVPPVPDTWQAQV
jgi:hypothetical protein